MDMKFEKTSAAAAFLAVMLSLSAGHTQSTVAVGATSVPAPSYQWNQLSTDYATDAPEDVTYFYADLSPYGQWVDLAGYGWCWQPGVVAGNPGWQPYCDAGHWTYTDSGWFWQSDYDWGWAPFHYGRWLHHEQCGWVWFPDRVWGPAWVTWRTAGNDCGWAPLPLHTTFEGSDCYFNGVRVAANFDFGLPASCFAFVGMGDFCSTDLAQRRLAQADVERIYNRTTIENNYRFVNKTVFDGGIPVERVAAVTHANLRPIPVRDEPAGGMHEGGASTVAYRRAPEQPENPVAMRAQKVDEQNLVIQPATPPPGGAEQRNASRPAPVLAAEPVSGGAQPYRNATDNHSTKNPQFSGSVPDSSQVEIIGPAPDAPPETPAGVGKAEYHPPHSAQVAAQAHALPPLFRPHDEPKPDDSGPSTSMEHVPRSKQVANQAHALPPLGEKPPPTELSKPGNPHPDLVTSPRGKMQQE
jgi:hypothetical protein